MAFSIIGNPNSDGINIHTKFHEKSVQYEYRRAEPTSQALRRVAANSPKMTNMVTVRNFEIMSRTLEVI